MSWTDTIVAMFPGGTNNKRLRQLTNEGGAASEIDTDALDAAVANAVGDFTGQVGFAPDETEGQHKGIVLKGVLYYLELVKGGDQKMLDAHLRTFRDGMRDLRSRVALSARTNSPLDPTQQRDGSRPDMDRGTDPVKNLTEARTSPGPTTLSPDD